MMLIDANLVLYAYDNDSRHHQRTREWLERLFAKPEPVCLAWTTILAFIRISTSSRAFRHPFSVEEAISVVSDWLSQPVTVVLTPGERHWKLFSRLLAQGP